MSSSLPRRGFAKNKTRVLSMARSSVCVSVRREYGAGGFGRGASRRQLRPQRVDVSRQVLPSAVDSQPHPPGMHVCTYARVAASLSVLLCGRLLCRGVCLEGWNRGAVYPHRFECLWLYDTLSQVSVHFFYIYYLPGRYLCIYFVWFFVFIIIFSVGNAGLG